MAILFDLAITFNTFIKILIWSGLCRGSLMITSLIWDQSYKLDISNNWSIVYCTYAEGSETHWVTSKQSVRIGWIARFYLTSTKIRRRPWSIKDKQPVLLSISHGMLCMMTYANILQTTQIANHSHACKHAHTLPTSALWCHLGEK